MYVLRITDLRAGTAFTVDLIKSQVFQVGSPRRGKWSKASLVLEAELKVKPNSPHTNKKVLGLLCRQGTMTIQV